MMLYILFDRNFDFSVRGTFKVLLLLLLLVVVRLNRQLRIPTKSLYLCTQVTISIPHHGAGNKRGLRTGKGPNIPCSCSVHCPLGTSPPG